MGQHAHSAEAPHGHDPAGAGSNAGHAAHGDTHHAGPTEPRLSAKKGQLELQPTCLCGCSETRSLIGGSASRLGAVVPGLSLVQLPDSSPAPVPGLDRLRWHDRFGPSDPIPI